MKKVRITRCKLRIARKVKIVWCESIVKRYKQTCGKKRQNCEFRGKSQSYKLKSCNNLIILWWKQVSIVSNLKCSQQKVKEKCWLHAVYHLMADNVKWKVERCDAILVHVEKLYGLDAGAGPEGRAGFVNEACPWKRKYTLLWQCFIQQ